MSDEIKKLIDLLKSEVGYREQQGGYTKFGEWYNNVEFDSDYSGQPWCDMFLSWAARQLGYQDWFGQFAYTVAHARWFQANGAWGDTPEVGALVFYDWSGSGAVEGIDHVGIVIAVDGDRITTIEGNIDGGQAREKARDQTSVVGYGYPIRIKQRLEETRTQAGGAPEAAALTARPTAHSIAGVPGTYALTLPAAATREILGTGAAPLLIPMLLAALVILSVARRRFRHHY